MHPSIDHMTEADDNIAAIRLALATAYAVRPGEALSRDLSDLVERLRDALADRGTPPY